MTELAIKSVLVTKSNGIFNSYYVSPMSALFQPSWLLER